MYRYCIVILYYYYHMNQDLISSFRLLLCNTIKLFGTFLHQRDELIEMPYRRG